MMRTGAAALVAALLATTPVMMAVATRPAAAAEMPAVAFAVHGQAVTLDRAALLARGDLTMVDIPDDVAYGRAMRYQAVPMAALMADMGLKPDDHLEVAALDGFVAQLPAALLRESRPGGGRACLAVEPADAPWPNRPGKDADAGPFYMVWLNPQAGGVSAEQWPYQVARFTATVPLLERFPAMRVDAALPADDPARAGEQQFAVQCAACHTIIGAGPAAVGPDLNLPMNPTEYLQAPALKMLIRDPKSVRSWGAAQMLGFSPDDLTDAEIDQVVAYLTHMAGRKQAPAR